MIDVKILNFSDENEFKNEEEFLEYFKEFVDGENQEIKWNTKFWNNQNELMGENDIIIFVYKNNIYGKARIKAQIPIQEEKYKTSIIIEDIEEVDKIPFKSLEKYFDKKMYHSQMNLYVEEEELNDFFEKFTENEEEFVYRIKQCMNRLGEKDTEIVKEQKEIRNKFVNKFNVEFIKNMTLEDYCSGRAKISENGKESFCYILETKLQESGEMRGSRVFKFGVWYDKETNTYKHTKRWGTTLEEAFQNLKESICKLIIDGKNEDYEEIEKNMISPIFKGKILSTYFPEKYLCVFEEGQIEKIISIMNLHYDVKKVTNVQQKKKLILDYKNSNDSLAKLENYYFVKLIYAEYFHELNKKEIEVPEINYNKMEQVDFEYLQRHIVKHYRKGYTTKKSIEEYEAQNRRQKRIGDLGENAVRLFEISKLEKIGREDLAQNVRIVDSDNYGYDIISYDEEGEEKHIEVKTMSQKINYMDFYLTENELNKMKTDSAYQLYYLFDIRKNPKYHILDKKKLLEKENEFLKPVIYRVSVDVLQK